MDYFEQWECYHKQRLDNYIKAHWHIPIDITKYAEKIPTPTWLLGSEEVNSVASVVKYLYINQYFTKRECALVIGKSESYVRKILDGERGYRYKPSLEKITDKSIEKLELLQYIMELHNYEEVPATSRHQYISLLAHMGYDYMQIKYLFAGNEAWFIWRAMNRSNKAWKDLNTSCLGIDQKKYNEMMNGK